MPKVSIVLPIYNGELTLRRCLDSILSQVFADFEVIVINDGGNDNSWEICAEYEKKDGRIKIINQDNKGVSAARNVGIRNASGEFITFVDCDDWVEPTMLSKMLSIIDVKNVDIVFMNFLYECGNTKHIGYLDPYPLSKKDIPSFPLAILLPEASNYYDHVKQDHDILGGACGKLYRKSLLNDTIWFDESLSVGEDCLFNLECFAKASDIFIDNTPVYHYTIHSDSANHKMRTNIIQQSEKFFSSYAKFSNTLEGPKAILFRELVKYRCYYELITRYIDHKNNNSSLMTKYKELSTCLQNPIYSYTCDIPAFLNIYKKLEVFFLKHKFCFFLLILNKIRTLVKAKLRHLK